MTDNKTPEEDFKRFEKFLDGMEDIEFEFMMQTPFDEGGFSSKQRRLASELREEVSEDDAFTGIGGYSGESFFQGLQGYRSRE